MTMNRRSFIRAAGSASFMLAQGGFPRIASARVSSQPNILLILTDQQHIDSIGAGGCTHVKTPALDHLLQHGVSFTRSYSSNPVCSPARSSIVTGRMSTETGVYINGKHIRKDIPNIGQWFAENSNYETLYAGKWHLPRTHQSEIEGFRVINTGIGGVGILGDSSTSRACAGYLRNRSRSSPFLMVASFMQPHDICEWLRLNTYPPAKLPYEALTGDLPCLPPNFAYDPLEPGYLQETRRSRDPFVGHWNPQQWRYYLWSYYRHIEQVDAEIGRILQALSDEDYDRNTVVLFTSDHGEGLAHHQMVRKSSPYDEAARVPLIVSYPGQIRENCIDTAQLVSGVDIVPTLCDFAGIKSPKCMRGTSLRPLLQGDTNTTHDFIVTELPGNRARMLRTTQYKYISYVDDPVDMLFDMQDDPGETTNLARRSKFTSLLSDLRRTLSAWERRLEVAPKVPNADAWRRVAKPS